MRKGQGVRGKGGGEGRAWSRPQGQWEGWGGAYFAQDDLRGQVLRGPTQGPGAAFHTLGKTKVCHLWAQEQGWQGGRDGPGHGHLGLPLAGPGGHLNVALLVDEKVLRLQVPVDEIKGVQVLEGQDDLGSVEAGMGLAGRDKRGDG